MECSCSRITYLFTLLRVQQLEQSTQSDIFLFPELKSNQCSCHFGNANEVVETRGSYHPCSWMYKHRANHNFRRTLAIYFNHRYSTWYFRQDQLSGKVFLLSQAYLMPLLSFMLRHLQVRSLQKTAHALIKELGVYTLDEMLSIVKLIKELPASSSSLDNCKKH